MMAPEVIDCHSLNDQELSWLLLETAGYRLITWNTYYALRRPGGNMVVLSRAQNSRDKAVDYLFREAHIPLVAADVTAAALELMGDLHWSLSYQRNGWADRIDCPYRAEVWPAPYYSRLSYREYASTAARALCYSWLAYQRSVNPWSQSLSIKSR